MKAVDTNIILRFLTLDDPDQASLATDCIRGGVYISHGVLMETEWALRSGYQWEAARINSELADLIAMECVEVDRADALRWALDRHRAGADWADMLHVIASTGYDAFVTFEKRLREGTASPVPVERLR